MYKSAKIDRYSSEEYWYRVGIMGSHHIQTSTGVIFNTPRAIKRRWIWRPLKYGRFQGTIIHRDDSKTISINHKRHPFFVVAEGNWWNSYDVTYDTCIFPWMSIYMIKAKNHYDTINMVILTEDLVHILVRNSVYAQSDIASTTQLDATLSWKRKGK